MKHPLQEMMDKRREGIICKKSCFSIGILRASFIIFLMIAVFVPPIDSVRFVC